MPEIIIKTDDGKTFCSGSFPDNLLSTVLTLLEEDLNLELDVVHRRSSVEVTEVNLSEFTAFCERRARRGAPVPTLPAYGQTFESLRALAAYLGVSYPHVFNEITMSKLKNGEMTVAGITVAKTLDLIRKS